MLDLQKLKDLSAKATQGPWKAEQGWVGNVRRLFLVRSRNTDGILFSGSYREEVNAQSDADTMLVAEAVNALPELIDRLEKAEKDAEAWAVAYTHVGGRLNQANVRVHQLEQELKQAYETQEQIREETAKQNRGETDAR